MPNLKSNFRSRRLRFYWLLISVIIGLSIFYAEKTMTQGSDSFSQGKLLTKQHFYLLQADALLKEWQGDDAAKRAAVIKMIANINADTFILDQYYANPPHQQGLYTQRELDYIRNAKPGKKRVILSYFSIGEAEDYRPYWHQSWDPNHNGKINSNNAPSWLLRQNPDWDGNYLVKYWNPHWQSLLMGSPSSPLDQIIAQGFDGVYLDIIDGFENFEQGKENLLNPETEQTYRRDVVDFVKKIAAYARKKKAGFLVVPQNGTQLVGFEDYLPVISGQGKEELYYNDNHRTNDSAEEVELLKKVQLAGKAVMVTDYLTNKANQDNAIERAQADGFSIFIAPHALDGLGRLP